MLSCIISNPVYQPTKTRTTLKYSEGNSLYTTILTRLEEQTCYSPRSPLCSDSLVCIENHLFIVGIGPIIKKELEFIFLSDFSNHTCVYS